MKQYSETITLKEVVLNFPCVDRKSEKTGKFGTGLIIKKDSENYKTIINELKSLKAKMKVPKGNTDFIKDCDTSPKFEANRESWAGKIVLNCYNKKQPHLYDRDAKRMTENLEGKFNSFDVVNASLTLNYISGFDTYYAFLRGVQFVRSGASDYESDNDFNSLPKAESESFVEDNTDDSDLPF